LSNIDDLLANVNIKGKVKDIYKRGNEVSKIMYPTASVGLTEALGGGFGAGRQSVVYGNTSAGKSALLMSSIGMWQEMGLTCAYLDSEMTFDEKFARDLGAEPDDLILLQTKSFGKAADQVVPLIKAGLDILVIDSISDLLPEQFLDEKGEMKDYEKQKQIGAHARSTSIFINALHYVNDKTALIMLSQTTTDLSGMYPKQIPMGGKKLGFASSAIVKLSSSSTAKEQLKANVDVAGRKFEEPVGRTVEWIVEKNKMGVAHGAGEYQLLYRDSELGPVGINRQAEMVDLALKYGVVTQAGAWTKYDGQNYSGKPGFLKHLRENPDVFETILTELQAARNGGVLEDE